METIAADPNQAKAAPRAQQAPAQTATEPSAVAAEAATETATDTQTTSQCAAAAIAAAEAGSPSQPPTASAGTAAAAADCPKPQLSPLQWLRQTYEQQWKGTVAINTIAADDHAPKNPHWLCCITATGAVVQDKTGRNVTLEPIVVDTEARSKKEAEQSAAEQIYTMMVDQGWYDPSKQKVSQKGNVVRILQLCYNLPAV